MMKSNFTLFTVITVFLTLTVAGCKTDTRSGGEIGIRDLANLCLGIADAQAETKRAKRRLKNAEIDLVGIRARILRTEKSNPVVAAALTQGLQGGGGRYSTGEGDYYSSDGGDGPRLLAWASALLENESIEARAQNLTWYVELRHAKEKYESQLDLAEDQEDDLQRAFSQMRVAGVREADCRKAGYW